MNILLIHGIRTKNAAKNSIGRLVPYLQTLGHNTQLVVYDDYGLFDALFRKYSVILDILERLKTAEAVVAHSNGCSYALKALALLRDRKVKVVMLAPAVRSKAKIPEAVDEMFVAYSKTDWVIWASKFVFWLPFGRMGWHGYKGNDERVSGTDMTDIVNDHDGYFDARILPYLSWEINYFIYFRYAP